MKSRQFRIRPDQEAACVELHPDVPPSDAVRLVLQRGIRVEQADRRAAMPKDVSP